MGDQFDREAERLLHALQCRNCGGEISPMFTDWQMCQICGEATVKEMHDWDQEILDRQEMRDHEIKEYVRQPRLAWVFLHGEMANTFDRFIDALTRGNRHSRLVEYSAGDGRCEFGPFLVTWSDQFDCIDFNVRIGKRTLYKHLVY